MNSSSETDFTGARGQASGFLYPEVIAELNKLQESKPAWGGTIWILLISVILFIAAGAVRWSWKFTLWLIPALLFHEGGHWVAMRIFKYRNLRMFFIPLFGAAVTGQNWNVAGWKKALVSLAGPLPGIALGCIIGIAGVITRREPLIRGALILVLLNGLNLLPILPLDGGRFMQAILFCRNRWLDVTFRVLTIAGLFGLTLLGLGKLLEFIAIGLAIYIPVAFKLGGIADSFRNANLPPPLPDQDRIPEQTAERIISEVKSALPQNLNNKVIAQHTLAVYENLNARPPGVLGTLGLGALYCGGICMAILMGALLLVAKEGRLGDFVRAAARQPHYSFTCGNVQQWQGSEAGSGDSPSRNLVVSSFKSAALADSTFAGLTNRIPTTSRLTLFGQSLLLTLPASDDRAREQWFQELQNISTNTFVVISNRPIMFTLMCVAPTAAEATNLQHVLTEYLDLDPGLRLVPPWSPEANGADFSKYENARRVWLRIGRELNAVWTNAEIKQLNLKIVAARKRGSMQEAKSLTGDMQELAKKVRQQLRDKMKSNPDFDPELVELQSHLTALEYTNTVERAAVLHQVSLKLGAPGDGKSDAALDDGATSGFVQRHGLLLEITWASMDNPSIGLPALAEWLCDKHCAGIHYEILAGLEESDD